MIGIVTAIEGIPLRGRIVGGVVKVWAHARDCACLLGQTFTCDRCGRRVGWCLGCWDNMPGACDFCWRDDGAPS